MRNRTVTDRPVLIVLSWLFFLTASTVSAQGRGARGTNTPDRLIFDMEGGDQARCERYRSRLEPAVGFAGGLPRIRSLLVVKNNFLVLEEYFNGCSRPTPANIKSIAKNILSALVGIAIENGCLEGIEETIATFFPDEMKNEADSRKKNITIGHLLTMTSGLATEINESLCPYVDSGNWVEYILKREMAHAPGDQWEYTTANTHLLSAVLTKATGESTLDFARKYLFDLLAVEPGMWEQDPQGVYYGGNNLFLTPIDLAKFGVLYLNGGCYSGRQVVPEDWVEVSTSKHSDQGRYWSPFHVYGYGYLWILFRIGKYDHFAAWGHGGQFVFIIPDLNLVVVITSQWEGPSSTQYYRDLSKLMEVYVVPACEGGFP